MSNMEGMLWKWTNYFSGWQPRWFVLEQGILSYYRSQDDVINGCKGSIKMSVCDVLVHPNDATRLDLIIPGEAHFYVKAATPQERQQWLVALGSSKACLSNNCLPLPSSPTAANAGLDELPEMPLKVKKSELRLYCDLLMQQVHSVKCAVQDKDQPDIERLNESTSLLSATCDTFISTLEECLRLAHANIDATFATGQEAAALLISSTGGGLSPTHGATPRSLKSKAIPWPVNSIQRSTSADRYLPSTHYSGGSTTQKKDMSRTTSESSDKDTSPPPPTNSSLDPSSGSLLLPHRGETPPVTYLDQNGRSDAIDEDVDDYHEPMIKDDSSSSPLPEIRLQTFFSKMDASFIDIHLTSDLEIPTVPFLDACRSILPIFGQK